MHFDQSKLIFTEEHLFDLKDIIRLAIPLDNRLKPPLDNRAGWLNFMEQYVKCTTLMTVTREYTEADLLQLEMYCDETYRLLISHCGGQAAVTNYFHYIGSGHVVWMCRNFGNIWRYRNEGVEAFNKTLSKRCNMFNSVGNKGRVAKFAGGCYQCRADGAVYVRDCLHDPQQHLVSLLAVAPGTRLPINVLKTKRFCTVTLARVSDMNSTFSASAPHV